jgi:hypothetical protein
MNLVLVTTVGSTDFSNIVVTPLKTKYPDFQLITLKQAVDSFPPSEDYKSWGIVVIELPPSEFEGDPIKDGLNFWTKNREESAGGLACAITQQAEVVVCYDGTLEKNVNDDFAYFGIHTCQIKDFQVSIVDELFVFRRAGIRYSQSDANGWLNFWSRYFDKQYPSLIGKVKELLAIELPDLQEQANVVRHVCDRLNRYDSSVIRELVCLMRAARLMAQLELEGSPFSITFVLGSKVPFVKSRLYDLACRKMLLSLESVSTLRNVCELVQGMASFIYVSVNDGLIRGIYELRNENRGKLNCFTDLASDHRAIVFHIPGNRTVELYTEQGQVLKYNGFSWERHLYKLRRSLPEKDLNFDHAKLIEAVELLSAQRLSSLIAIDPDNFPKQSNISLKPLREDKPPRQPVDQLNIETMVSIFRLDGVHLIGTDGVIRKIAQNVQIKGSSARRSSATGTGRLAAEALSRAFPHATIIKVSASNGIIKIYEEGREV